MVKFGEPIPADFPAPVFVQRRQRLADRLGEAVALVFAARQREDRRFVQYPNFYYLTGLEVPDAVLVLWPAAPREEWREVLFLPPRDATRELWTGPVLTPDTKGVDRLGFTSVEPLTQRDAMVARFLRQQPRLAVVAEAVAVSDPLTPTQAYVKALRDRFPALEVVDLSRDLDDLRRVKDAQELELLERAVVITAEALTAAVRAIRPGMYEYQVQAVLEYEFRRCGAMGPAFPTIVAAGPRATVLHYDRNEGRIAEGDLIVLDVGARYGYYCADISRTVPATGRFTDRQRDLYRQVLAAQARALAAVRPGARIRDDVHAAARTVLEEAGLDRFFPHSIGHYLGLEVHDPGDVRAPLEPGVVLTVEPGVYIREEGIGIRIEDDVVVTETGHRVLSAAVPREPEEVEAWMRGAG